ERPAQKSTRARCVHDEAGADMERLSGTRANEHRIAVWLPVDAIELDEVLVIGAERDRLLDQKTIDVAAQPVRIGDLVARARRDEQLVRSIAGRIISASRFVLEVGE